MRHAVAGIPQYFPLEANRCAPAQRPIHAGAGEGRNQWPAKLTDPSAIVLGRSGFVDEMDGVPVQVANKFLCLDAQRQRARIERIRSSIAK